AADGRRGWAVGYDGTIVTTEDGGEHWTLVRYRRLPSLAALLGSGGLLLVAGTVITTRRQRAAQRVRTLLDRAVSDAAIDDPADDRFGFARIAAATAAFLRNPGTRAPLVLAFTAPWGCGKSSMMNLLRRALARSDQPPVWFNAWHHQKEEVLLAPLLDAVIRHGFPPLLGHWCLPNPAGFAYHGRLFLRRAHRRPKLALFAVLLLAGGAVRLAYSWFTSHPAVPVAAGNATTSGPAGDLIGTLFDPFIGLLAETIEGLGAVLQSELLADLLGLKWADFWKHTAALLDDPVKLLNVLAALALLAGGLMLWRLFLRSLPESPSDLLALARGSTNKSGAEAQAAFRNRFREHFHDAAAAALPRPLTIFIDDLDRLPPDKAMEMLEAINFLASCGPCVIVLGIARDVVLAQITQKTGELALARHHLHQPPVSGAEAEAVKRRYAEDYLRKLIQIAIPIPQTPVAALVNTADETGNPDAAAGRKRWWQGWREVRVVLVISFQRLIWAGIAAVLVGIGIAAGERWQETQRHRLETRQQQTRTLIADWQSLQHETLSARQQLETLVMRVDKAVKDAAGKKPSVQPQGMPCAKVVAPTLDTCREQLAVLRIELDRLVDGLKTRTEELVRLAAAEHGVKKDTQDDYRRWHTESGQRLATWKADLDKLKPAVPAASVTDPAKPADRTSPSPLERERPATGTDDDSHDNSPGWWEYGIWLIGLVAIGLGFWRDRHRSGDTDEFARALDYWTPFLQADPHRSTPREITRFLNRARYAAARLGSPDPDRRTEPASDGNPPVPDRMLVELAAAFHRLPEGMSLPGQTHLPTL
ncbi:MAG TPA: P-loop NTPase fold protein, partial [Plasticicumulans sp.]|nr:P-loop NTPase fold protein [Plasticicumulans sp.]